MTEWADAANDLETTPYWWQPAAAYPPVQDDLPAACDVAIVGGGYTGLAAALRLAAAGSRVVVLEAEQFGFGASTRNGGMVSGVLKHSPRELKERYGRDTAEQIFQEAQSSVPFLEELLERHAIECEYQRSGMYFAAYTPKHYAKLRAEQEALAHVGVETEMVPAERQHTEINSNYYHGGRILRLAGGLHPGRFHHGLAWAAQRAGVQLLDRARVSGIQREKGGWALRTARGDLRADAVVLATNGYVRGGPPWLERRIIPIRSYVIATEVLGRDSVRALIPRARMIQDTKNILYYFRPSPDGTRLVFGGRASFTDIPLRESARRLLSGVGRIFPELRNVRASHSWNGTVGFTFDRVPHIGRHDGLFYALGYCGQGVAMSNYLGDRVGRLVLDPNQSVSIFQDLPFASMVGYRGNPWFLPVVSALYKAGDYLERRLAT